MVEAGHNRRADVVVFINGLPLGLVERKNPGDENATIWDAFTQLQTYKQQIPSLFTQQSGASEGLSAAIRKGRLTGCHNLTKIVLAVLHAILELAHARAERPHRRRQPIAEQQQANQEHNHQFHRANT